MLLSSNQRKDKFWVWIYSPMFCTGVVVSYKSSFHPASLVFLTRRFTSWDRALVVTSKVSGMSTITRSSTPRHVMRRPDIGTTIPPATCSVSTGQKNVSICN